MLKKNSDMKVEVKDNLKEGPGSVTFQHYFTADEITANSRLCAKLTIPPGAGVGAHQHLKEDEVFIITKGTGMLDDGSSKTRVDAGDAILTGDQETHSLLNDGDENLELIAVIMSH